MASKTCVLSLKAESGYGWSEQYHYNGPTDLASMTTTVQGLASTRALMLAGKGIVEHARVQGTVKRNAIIISLNNGAGYPGSQSGGITPQEVAIEVLLQSAAGHYGRKFLRGGPQRVVNGQLFQPDDEFTTAANAWITQLQGFNNWNVVGHPQSGSLFTLSDLIPTAPRGFTGISTGLVLSNGSTYRVSGSVIPGYNGLKTVTQIINPTTGLYQFGGAAPGSPDTSPAIKIQSLQAYDEAIGSVLFLGISRRAAGRPFGLSRGRRETLYSLRR